ncbi:glycosyltransferase family 39 protein [Anaerolineales bacterium HSG6]|nr:glycosyltransferase family 39 protein [Anaerolineales bacterium HSG6]
MSSNYFKRLPVLFLWLAFTLQLSYLNELRQTFPDRLGVIPFCGVDSLAHLDRAHGLLNGSIPGPEVFYFIPLYPLYLATFQQFFDGSLFMPLYIQSLFQMMGLAALYKLGRQLYSPLTGLLAMIGLASYSYYLLYLPCFDQTMLTTPALTIGLTLLLSEQTRPRRLNLLIAGISFAVAILSRPTVLMALPLVLLWIGWLKVLETNTYDTHSGMWEKNIPRRRTQTILLSATLFLLPIICAIAPLTWHNYQVSGRFVLISDNFGINLFTGNNPDAYGLDSLAHVQSQPAVLRFEETIALIKQGQTSYEREVISYWQTDPQDALELTLLKTWYWFGETEEPLIEPFFPSTVGQSAILRMLPLGWQAVIVIALLGITLIPTCNRPALWFVWAVYAVFSLFTILFFIQLRFRVPLIPFVMLSSGALLSMAPTWLAQRHWKFGFSLAVMLILVPLIPGLVPFIVLFVGLGVVFSPANRVINVSLASWLDKISTPTQPPPARGRSSRPPLEAHRKDEQTSPLAGGNEGGRISIKQTSTNWNSFQATPRYTLMIALLLYLSLIMLITLTRREHQDVGQAIDHYLGPPLIGQGILGQTFRMDCDNLSQIEATLGTFNDYPDQPIIFTLTDSPTNPDPIHAETFLGQSVTDYQRRVFQFPPIPDSAGREFFFYLTSPTATAATTITARGYGDTPIDQYPDGQALAGPLGQLQPIQADVAFVATCEQSWWEQVWAVFGDE